MMNLMQAYLKTRKIEITKERERKYKEMRSSLEQYFKDLEYHTGNYLNIPYFLRAEMELDKVINRPEDIDFYYKKFLKWKTSI